MTSPNFGMEFPYIDEDFVTPSQFDFSETVVIEAAQGESASNEVYPIDKAVQMSTSNTEQMAALGDGPLKAEVQGIHDQLKDLNAGASVTIVRVAEGADFKATANNIKNITDSLHTIPDETKSTPHIVVAGRTDWRDGENTNPVVSSLESNLGKILAVAPVQINSTSRVAAIADREKINSDRIMPIGVGAMVHESGANPVQRSIAGRVAGLFVRVDNLHKGKPFNPVADQHILGLAGLSRDINFNLFDGSTEGQQMLEADIAIAVAGQVGRLGAASTGGFRFIGLDSAKGGESRAQLHQVRGTDYVVAGIADITTQYLGKKISYDLVEHWLGSIQFWLRDLKADGDILGYTKMADMFKADKNSPENIRKGWLNIEVATEVASGFKRAVHEIKPNRQAVKDFVESFVNSIKNAA